MYLQFFNFLILLVIKLPFQTLVVDSCQIYTLASPLHSPETLFIKGTVSRYIDKNRTGACGLGRNRRLLRHTELVFLSSVCARRVVLVLFTNMDATIVVN